MASCYWCREEGVTLDHVAICRKDGLDGLVEDAVTRVRQIERSLTMENPDRELDRYTVRVELLSEAGDFTEALIDVGTALKHAGFWVRSIELTEDE